MKKRILLIGELYRPLIPWFLEDQAPSGAPAVYNLYQYLGNSKSYTFYSVVYNPYLSRKKVFPNGSVIEMRKFRFPFYYLWKFIVFFKLLLYGTRLLKNEQFDLVYGLSTFTTVAALLGRWCNVKSVGRIYGTILTKAVEDQNYFRLYTRFIFDVLAIKIPADIVISTQDGTQYDKVFHFFNKSRKVNLLYNGMERQFRQSLLDIPLTKQLRSPLKLCYIARLESYKRQEIAIEIIRHLVNKHQYKAVQLTIVGTGSRERFLRELVKRYQLSDYVRFLPEKPHQEIPAFLESQDASLFFYEGGSLGNVLWESALAGKLIITVNNAGTGELFKDGENCLIGEESADFSEKMAEKIHLLRSEEVGDLTAASRSLVAGLISDWKTRFDREFDKIFQEEKLKETIR